MDAFLTTVVGGVIVALAGAIAAFYFGRLQERHKQEHERKQEEQRRLEERQNREEEQNKQGAAALVQIEEQASVIVEDVRSWAENAAGLPESVPPDDERSLANDRALAIEWRELLEKYAEVVQQRDSIATKMDSLRLSYREHAIALPRSSGS
jgi:hypothetical protein